ncbi:MAG: sensor histidine kinase [Bryobacterales bacterium]|nr:sensor histidine kinase [Bryobacterales bacterium]
MAAGIVLVPHTWRRALAVMRVFIALSCLVFQIQWSGRFSGLSFLLALYLVGAIATLFWRPADRAAQPLLILFVDFGIFLIWTYAAAGRFLFVTAAFFVCIVLRVSLLHSWYELSFLLSVLAVFLGAARPIGASGVWLIMFCAGTVGLVLTLHREILQNRLSSTARQSVILRAEAEKSREEERQRIAADFHDGPLQSFVSVQMRLEIVRKMLIRDFQRGMDELRQLQELCHSQVVELRSFIRSMRPAEIEGAGMITSIRHLVERFQKDSGMTASFHDTASVSGEEPELSTEVLSIVREALNNVQKHSKASRVAVSVSHGDSALDVVIEDDGTGFTFSGNYSLEELELLRLGPDSIKRRIRSLGGDLTLDSRPGSGASMRIRVPHA